jgi:cytochrome c-type biogenesis protein CcmH/NrfF
MKEFLAALLLFSNMHPLTLQQSMEVKKVEESLFAPCCYTQSIAVHTSPIAQQMRQEVTQMVAAGKSETEIVAHYKTLYGEQILIVPDGRTGVLLFLFPFAVFLGASGILVLSVRKMLRKKTGSFVGPVPDMPVSKWDAIRAEIDRATGESN